MASSPPTHAERFSGGLQSIFDPKLTDNCCVNVSAYAREVTAFTETAIPLRFAPDTLKTLGVFGYGEALTGQISTAHPHYDAKRACHYNYIADLGMKSVYRLCRIGDDGTRFELAAIPVERPAYMHSFGMSADHLILTEFPLVVNPIDLRLSGKPFIQNYRWEAERGLVFHVVAKERGAGWCARSRPMQASPSIMSTPSPMPAALPSMSSSIPTRRLSISSTWRGSAPGRRSPPSAR